MSEVTKPDAFEGHMEREITHADSLPAYDNGFRDGARWAREWTLREASEALAVYGRHTHSCDLSKYAGSDQYDNFKCTCGLTKKLAAWKEKGK